ncbi:set domain protein [Artemisia annua]|uniref:Set domain protein n=1 Tax=Artemisia annua TaxID=35608 RepID=A0A2U1QK27_ARTAN|nr:set domain protein [Artemisia annua]
MLRQFLEPLFFFFFHLQYGFFTSRDVKPMEELTLEYGIDSNDDFHLVKAFVCKCESKHCRQTKHKNPKRHLLTTGASFFVSSKRLIAYKMMHLISLSGTQRNLIVRPSVESGG